VKLRIDGIFDTFKCTAVRKVFLKTLINFVEKNSGRVTVYVRANGKTGAIKTMALHEDGALFVCDRHFDLSPDLYHKSTNSPAYKYLQKLNALFLINWNPPGDSHFPGERSGIDSPYRSPYAWFYRSENWCKI
jgi:hypothetical protein